MEFFRSVKDIINLDPENPDQVSDFVQLALKYKNNIDKYRKYGKGLTIGLIFMNPSLRTRLSTQKAAKMLGMEVLIINIDKESWAIEWQDGAVMNGSSVEHIKEAAGVLSIYCDILAIRSFPSLTDREADDQEFILNQLIKYSKTPIISLESATLHPLQSLADAMTIEEVWNLEEHKKNKKAKVVLSWAPHIKAIPQVVANSFSEWMLNLEVDFTICHPKGYELNSKFTEGAKITNNQDEAIEDADFVYLKNWSAYNDYGKILTVDENWLLTNERIKKINSGYKYPYIMHCLPVRRNIEVADELLDSPKSLIMHQAENRIYSAFAVLKTMIETNF
jgi:N-succinyl-L-ornithine transcarbamylase